MEWKVFYVEGGLFSEWMWTVTLTMGAQYLEKASVKYIKIYKVIRIVNFVVRFKAHPCTHVDSLTIRYSIE